MIMIAINERLQLWPLTTSPCSLLYPPVNCNCQPLSYAGMAMLTARSLRCNNHFLVLVVAAVILFLLLLPHSSLAIRTTHSDRVDFQFTNSTADSNVSLDKVHSPISLIVLFSTSSTKKTMIKTNKVIIRSWFISFNVLHDFYSIVELQFNN